MKPTAKNRRAHWVGELAKLSGKFGDDSTKLLKELRSELVKDGTDALLDHLRTCGGVPERYGHDSSEEKLYSKYTDAVISESFSAMGLKSSVITARADVADVQARGRYYSLVADAKAFRLSRTAKNQKDFKVQAMDGWRTTLDYAVLVCPVYQLPTRASQIYHQAIARNVCILSYCHIAALVALADRRGKRSAEAGFHEVLKSVSLLQPTKSSVDYWTVINRSLVGELASDLDLWTTEKTESIKALELIKKESLAYLVSERNRLLGLSHAEAINELVRRAGLDSRIAKVQSVEHGNLLGS